MNRISRGLTALLLLVLVSGCRGGPDAPSTGEFPPRTPAASAGSAVALADPTRAEAVRQVRSVRAPTRFRLRIDCTRASLTPRARADCTAGPLADATWVTARSWTGHRIPAGNGLAENAALLVAEFPTRRAARRAEERFRRVQFARRDGDFRIAVRYSRDHRSYVPGAFGSGEVADSFLPGWPGAVYVGTSSALFDREATSATRFEFAFALRRARWIAQGFVIANDRPTRDLLARRLRRSLAALS